MKLLTINYSNESVIGIGNTKTVKCKIKVLSAEHLCEGIANVVSASIGAAVCEAIRDAFYQSPYKSTQSGSVGHALKHMNSIYEEKQPTELIDRIDIETFENQFRSSAVTQHCKNMKLPEALSQLMIHDGCHWSIKQGHFGKFMSLPDYFAAYHPTELDVESVVTKSLINFLEWRYAKTCTEMEIYYSLAAGAAVESSCSEGSRQLDQLCPVGGLG